jgi:AcrR family transcriptional regulator
MRLAPYHHGDLRAALVEAALALLRERGVAALTLRAVARRAGVSHMAPYHHFADRQALVAALAQRGFERLLAAVRTRARRAGGDPLGQFRESAFGYVLFAVRNPALYRVMFGPEVARPDDHPGYRAAADAAYALITDGARALRAQGVIHWDDLDGLCAAIWAQLHGLAVLLLDGKLARGRDLERAAIELTTAATRLMYVGLRG